MDNRIQKFMTHIVWGDTGNWVDPLFSPPDELVDNEIEQSLLDNHDCKNSPDSSCDCALLDERY